VTDGRALPFALRAAAVALAAGALVTVIAALDGAGSAAWAAIGWAPAAAVGVAAGTWLAAVHGRRDASFVKALGFGMLARFGAVLVSTALALSGGPAVYRPCLAGIAAAYVSLQAFEIVWFVRDGARAVPER